MTRIPHDQFAKDYLEVLLESLGTVQRNLEVPGESRFVDLWFVPATPLPDASELGLLHQMLTTACLLEPFRNSPTQQEVRNCLQKLFALQDSDRRKAKRAERPFSDDDLPWLWVLAATTYRPMLSAFAAQIGSAGMRGIYYLPEGNKAVIIAIYQLPEMPETLWFRILGRGSTQRKAIQELLALPPDTPRRDDVLRLLSSWRVTLEISQPLDVEEQQLMAALSQAYLEWEQKTEDRGVQRGATQEARSLILRLLTRRIGALSPSLQSQVEGLPLPQLEALGEALLDFTGPSDLEQWLATPR
jgi:hypothetical protein